MNDLKIKTRLPKVIYVVDGEGGSAPLRVVINQGSSDGIKSGDRFIVFGIGPHIHDPDTGADLGELEIVRGQGQVVHLQENMATIRSTERRRTRSARRIIRDPNAFAIAHAMGVFDDEIAPEAELPFESVQLGDFAKPI